MKLLRQQSPDEEPEWDSFSISATDFRPLWDGNLVNVFTTIRPLADAGETQTFAMECARHLAAWILTERSRFGAGDRFQIIIGWPKDVRATGRQIIKAGGNFSQLREIASGATAVSMRGNWTSTVFPNTNSEPIAGGNPG